MYMDNNNNDDIYWTSSIVQAYLHVTVQAWYKHVQAWWAYVFVFPGVKIDFVVFHPKPAVLPQSLTAGEMVIYCSDSTRDLEAFFDQHMTIIIWTISKVNSVCCAAYFHLYCIVGGTKTTWQPMAK